MEKLFIKIIGKMGMKSIGVGAGIMMLLMALSSGGGYVMDFFNDMLPDGMRQAGGLMGTTEREPILVATVIAQQTETGETVEEIEIVEVYEDFDFQAEVLRISDGDTILVRIIESDEELRVRLFGIDTPEMAQPHGKRSRAALVGMLGNNIYLMPEEIDQYGRLVAWVYTDDPDRSEKESVNTRLVRGGMAYRYMTGNVELGKAEREARLDGRGVWADDEAVMPWDFRAASK